MLGKVFMPAVSAARHCEVCMSGQCFIELSRAGKVRPVSLLSSDSLSSLPGSVEVRSASVVDDDKDANTSPPQNDDSIEQRLKRMEEENNSRDERVKSLEEENHQLKQRLENDRNVFENENRKLKERLAAVEENLQQNSEVSSEVAEKSSTSSTRTVKVNGIRHGGLLLVLYVMARECVDTTTTGGVSNRTASRMHREEHSVHFRWEWWAGRVVFSFFLQMAMMVILHHGLTILARTSDDVAPLPAWQTGTASVVFLYDACRTGIASLLRNVYCYWRMESLELFQKHTNPKRTSLAAVLLVGWEALIFASIAVYGIGVLAASQSPLDLILNVVALHFLYEIDDYVMHLAPGLGLLGDIDVPDCVVLPKYITEPKWRDFTLFYWFARITQYITLDVPILPIAMAVLWVFLNEFTVTYYQEDPGKLENVYTARTVSCVNEFIFVLYMAVPSVMAISSRLEKKTNGNLVIGADRKVACIILVYFLVLTPASVVLNAFLTKQLALEMWLPGFIGAGLSWSCFMTVVLLLIH